MSFWTFSDVFEEDGVKPEPFLGYFGLIAPGGIRKPSFSAFAMLHRLGNERLANAAKDALITRQPDGTLVVAVWSEADPHVDGVHKQMHLQFAHVPADAAVRVTRLDATHGNAMAAYKAMGSPRYPTQVQIAQLNVASETWSARNYGVEGGRIDVDVQVNALVLLEVAGK